MKYSEDPSNASDGQCLPFEVRGACLSLNVMAPTSIASGECWLDAITVSCARYRR